jgi:hypothetical protein
MIRSLAKDLDKKLEGVSKIHAYKPSTPTSEMVEVLSELISAGRPGRRDCGLGVGAGRAAAAPLASSSRSVSRSSRSANSLGTQAAASTGRSAGRWPGRDSRDSPPGDVGHRQRGESVGEVRVTADPYTNSLLISAGPQDYDVLKRVIQQLDIPRRQVFVEAIILEIGLQKSKELGFEYQGGTALGSDALGLARLNLKNLNPAITSPGSISGLVMAAVSNQTIGRAIGTAPAQVALFTASSRIPTSTSCRRRTFSLDNQRPDPVGQNIPVHRQPRHGPGKPRTPRHSRAPGRRHHPAAQSRRSRRRRSGSTSTRSNLRGRRTRPSTQRRRSDDHVRSASTIVAHNGQTVVLAD